MAIQIEILHEFKPFLDQDASSSKDHVSWSVSTDPLTGAHHELCVHGNRVVWLEGLNPGVRTVKKVYSVETDILQAFWCRFRSRRDRGFAENEDREEAREGRKERGRGDRDGGDRREEEGLLCICVRELNCLTLFLQTGAIHYVPLPFVVHQIWPINGGLLVARQISSDWGYDGLPTLFTLLHPMDDFCPVTCKRPAATTSEVCVVGFFSSPQMVVVDVSSVEGEGMPLLVCYDSSTQRHSIWSIQQATREEIPAHINTPQRPASGPNTPQNPLSSSAPSCYGTQATPLTMMDTPVEMILSTRKQGVPPNGGHTQGVEPLKIPALIQLQRQASPWGVLSGSARSGEGSGLKSTGRSPFVSRLQTPQNGTAQLVKKRSKSLSPPILARLSPFSQTVNSRSWSTFYSEELSFGHMFEPLVPQICIHHLWQEQDTTQRSSSLGAAHNSVTSFFKTSDLIGRHYLAMLIPSLSQLHLLSYDIVKGGAPSFGALTTIHAAQVVPLHSLSMILVMGADKQLMLYSGPHKVAMVTLLRPSPSPTESDGMGGSVDSTAAGGVAKIQDALGNSFTMELISGEMFRCSLPSLCRHPVVSLCLEGMKQLLPADSAMALLSAYYNSSHRLPYSSSLSHFHGWLLSCLNLNSTKMEEDSDAEAVHLASRSSLQCIQAMMDSKMLNSVPALKLFTSTEQLLGVSVASNPAAPTSASSFTTSLETYREAVVYSLHLVYEEMKTNVLFYDSLFSVGNLLYQIVSSLGWQLYMEHYEREFPSLFLNSSYRNEGVCLQQPSEEEQMDEGHVAAIGGMAIPLHPPSLVHWLHQKLGRKQPPPFPVLPAVCKRTITLLKSYALFTSGVNQPLDLASCLQAVGGRSGQVNADQFCNLATKTAASCHERIVLNLVTDGIGHSDLETFPVGMALPLWDSIVRCQERPPSSWPPAAYDLIGRVDVAKSLSFSAPTFTPKIESPDNCEDGMNIDNEILKLQFPKDLRVNEVRRLLQSSKPTKIALTQKPEVSDHEFLEQQETHLLAVCQRTMALPVGRGMFTLALSQPLPTAPLAIPPLNLSGRVPPRNASVGLDHVEKPSGMTVWAEFHNGAAAGLKISPHLSQLDSTWIVSNRPSEELSDEFAGFLMALGLSGHLASLHEYNLYGYLHEKHELTVIGLLVGLTASRAGSMADSLISLLSIYFPPLLPHGSADLEVAHSIQIAALVGVGLLYLGSAHRHMVEVALRQIGHAPGPELEFAMDRESYSLAAGLALGMITLGKGGNCVGLSDLHLVDQLCVYMNGGPKSLVAMEAASGTSQLVLEGDQVNYHVTAPGAIIALGLMYLKTNDIIVAATLDAPGTQYELDCIRPDFLLLRALSRGLIMWDSIQPSQDWINNHVPELVRKHAFQGGSRQKADYSPTLDYQTLSQALVNIQAGCCMAMGLCYAGTCDRSAFKCLLDNAKDLLGKLESSTAEPAMKPCLETCLDTTVIALSLVMSGSGDLDVLKLIRRLHVRIGHPEVHYGSHMAVHMALGLLFLGGGRYSLSRSNKSVAALVCALYPKFPNSSTDNRYHLQALRHLYVLAAEPRILVTRDVRTGEACSVNVIVRCDNGRKEGAHSLTPCIIPEWSSIKEVEVCSDQYLPIRLDLSSERTRQALSMSGTIFVKRRTSHTAKLSGSSFSAGNYGIGKVKGTIKLPCDELTTDPAVRALSKQFMMQNSPWTQFVSAALLECIQQEKLQALIPYFQLEQSAQSVCNNLDEELIIQHLWQIKLARMYVESAQHDHTPLVSCDFTEALYMRLRTVIDRAVKDSPNLSGDGLNDVLKWYLLPNNESKQHQLLSRRDKVLLLLTLLLYDIPSPGMLKLKSSTTVPELYQMMNSQGVPVTAVVRLLPILQSPQIPGF